jgi:hypothetical protein
VGFAGVLLALAVPFCAAFPRLLGRVGMLLGAAASIGVVALLASNVFGEDDYVSDGRSRWETRTGSAHTLFVLEVVLGVLVAAGFALIALRPRSAARVSPLLTAAAVLEAVGAWVVLVAYNSN